MFYQFQLDIIEDVLHKDLSPFMSKLHGKIDYTLACRVYVSPNNINIVIMMENER